MTAISVDGVAVIADEPTASGIVDRGGKPVVWTQTRTLRLADGRTVYGCLHCDRTSTNPLSIRPHLSVHSSRPRKTTKAAAARAVADLPLGDLLARLAELDQLTADRDTWKARAQTAERKLATLRNALGGNK
ncbi:hypothetical protein [Amycolatopsis sp. BJA-103]|uniref:hypothetical protein n=1 Tax=Amycolatopsis sp. BJA-103 TaxID=1911175 RepID=UPI000C75BBF2|nr:hypothetical protein [Amycolatopsis sp. BJA-103]AUI56757.1 hypothetical protein BKN51_00050 [Amycolatopsis sp. BJA-103]AUI56819.1 hypothetical protein BKN51_00380 [Amycolatopsis sp. BJA-103]PNE13462.1 hypothetical protein B1H26_40250 [Amycolatopsis sp. BJA-103]